MKWQPKNVMEAFIPVGILFAILGHGPIQYPLGRPRILISIIYATITGFLYYAALGYMYKSVRLKSEEKVYFFVTQFNIAIAGLSQFLSWYHSTTFFSVVTRLMKVDETLIKLGASLNYTSARNLGIMAIIYWLILVVGLNSLDVWWLMLNGKFTIFETYAFIATLRHPSYVNFIVALNFCLGARIAEERFYELNELIVNASKSYFHYPPNDRTWNLLQSKNGEINNTLSTRRYLKFDENRKSLIQTTKHVHLELMVISRSVEKIYGVQMTLQMACYFISFTGLLYDIINLIINPHVYNKRNVRILTTSIWASVTIVNLIIINRSCEHVIAEARRTGDVIHYIQDPTGDAELCDEIKQFSLQIENDPLGFSPVGFFPLGYKFLRMFLGTVMTYLVILIQTKPDVTKL